jgi:hypothetical protein
MKPAPRFKSFWNSNCVPASLSVDVVEEFQGGSFKLRHQVPNTLLGIVRSNAGPDFEKVRREQKVRTGHPIVQAVFDNAPDQRLFAFCQPCTICSDMIMKYPSSRWLQALVVAQQNSSASQYSQAGC